MAAHHPTARSGRRAALAAAVLAAAVGCAGRPCPGPPAALADRPWANGRGTPDPYPNPDADLVAGLDAASAGVRPPPIPGRPLSVLVLPGGGKFGVFTGGVLCGWSAAGTRPTFDVVTGVSSGALTAVYAFLGPAYDARMASTFTLLRPSDLSDPRPVRGLLGGGALTSSAPLARLIARDFDAAAMDDMRAAHRSGRRLFVATGNAITLRPVIWDVGAIACGGRPDADDLVRKILLAACSIPGYAPSVEFEVVVNGVRYRELHGDAGNVIQAFVRTADGLPPGSGVYVVAAGKLYRDPLPGRPGVLGAAGAAVSNALHALFRDDLMRVYAQCAVTGARFHLAAIPPDLPVRPGSMSFDTEELGRLFETGYRMGADGGWRTTPPGVGPGEELVPRAGLEFVAPEPGPAAGDGRGGAPPNGGG